MAQEGVFGRNDVWSHNCARRSTAPSSRRATPPMTEARTVFVGGIDRRLQQPSSALPTPPMLSRSCPWRATRDWNWPSVAAATAGPGTATSEGGIVLDLRDLRELDIDRAPHRMGGGGTDGRRIHRGGRRLWPGDGLRRQRLGGYRGHHPGRRRRLPGSQARADHRRLAVAEIVTADGQILHTDADNLPRTSSGPFGAAAATLAS